MTTLPGQSDSERVSKALDYVRDELRLAGPYPGMGPGEYGQAAGRLDDLLELAEILGMPEDELERYR